MAFGVTEAISAAAGLAGMFGGKRKTAAQRKQEELLAIQADLMRQRAALAASYDPAKEDAEAFRQLEESGSRVLANASKRLNQNFKVGGGSPTGDTNFKLGMQRTTDDILGEIARIKAERLSTQAARKMAALDGAMQAPTGVMFSAYQTLSESTAPNVAGAQAVLGQVIDKLPGQKTKAPMSNGSKAPVRGQNLSRVYDAVKASNAKRKTNSLPSWMTPK